MLYIKNNLGETTPLNMEWVGDEEAVVDHIDKEPFIVVESRKKESIKERHML